MRHALPVLFGSLLTSAVVSPVESRPRADLRLAAAGVAHDGIAFEGAAQGVAGETAAGEGVAEPATGEPDSSVEALAWLAGCWVSETERTTTEECWLGPRNGQMLGLNRSWNQDGRSAFEFLRIAAEEGRVIYWASPGGRPPTGFTLSGSGRRYAVFENPGHDFPQRIHYWMAEDGRLHARVEADTAGGSHGFELVFESGESPCEQARAPEAAAEP